jgi:hypothetical protein
MDNIINIAYITSALYTNPKGLLQIRNISDFFLNKEVAKKIKIWITDDFNNKKFEDFMIYSQQEGYNEKYRFRELLEFWCKTEILDINFFEASFAPSIETHFDQFVIHQQIDNLYIGLNHLIDTLKRKNLIQFTPELAKLLQDIKKCSYLDTNVKKVLGIDDKRANNKKATEQSHHKIFELYKELLNQSTDKSDMHISSLILKKTKTELSIETIRRIISDIRSQEIKTFYNKNPTKNYGQIADELGYPINNVKRIIKNKES